MSEKLRWAPVMGACITATMLVGLALTMAFGPAFLVDFLKGPASGWAQAIGSITAVGVAYWLAQDAHRQQILRDERRDAARAANVARAVGELLRQVKALDDSVSQIAAMTAGSTWPVMGELARELIETSHSLPLVDIPHVKILSILSGARLDVTSYITWARRIETGSVHPDTLEQWRSFGANASQRHQKSIDDCLTMAAGYDAVANGSKPRAT